ncbi:hypothetical protein FQN60_017545, partial [Etheostoma spectabile]
MRNIYVFVLIVRLSIHLVRVVWSGAGASTTNFPFQSHANQIFPARLNIIPPPRSWVFPEASSLLDVLEHLLGRARGASLPVSRTTSTGPFPTRRS